MTYTEEVVGRSPPERSQLLGLCRRHGLPSCQRAFSLQSARNLAVPGVPVPHSVGSANGLLGWGWAGGGSKAAASASPAPLPAPEREAAEAQPWPQEPEE